LRRGDASVDRKIQELSASKIHLGHPRAYASSAVRKMSGTDLDLLQKCLPTEGTICCLLLYGNRHVPLAVLKPTYTISLTAWRAYIALTPQNECPPMTHSDGSQLFKELI